MPKEISIAIIILFLEGYLRDEIAKELDISQGKVSSVLGDLKKSIGESLYEFLKEFGKSLRKNKLRIDDAIIGFHIKSLLTKIGVDVEKVKGFVEGFYSACIQNGVEPAAAITIVKKVIDIQKNEKISFEEISEKYQKIIEKIKIAENKLAKLENDITITEQEKSSKIKIFNEKIEEITKKHNELFLKYNTNEKKVMRFDRIFTSLEKKNIPIEDTEKFDKMMENAKRQNYDENKIMNQIMETDRHQDSLKNAKNELCIIEEKISSLKPELASLQSQKNEDLEEISNLKDEIASLNQIINSKRKEVTLLTDLFQKQLEDMLESFSQKMANAKNHALTEFQYLVSDTRKSWESFIEQEKLDAQSTKMNLDQSCNKLNEKCVEFGKLKSNGILMKIIEGTGDPHEVLLAMMIILQRFRAYVSKSKFESREMIQRITATLIGKIQEDLDALSKDN